MIIVTYVTPPTATPLDLLLVEGELLQSGDLTVVVLSTAPHQLFCDWVIQGIKYYLCIQLLNFPHTPIACMHMHCIHAASAAEIDSTVISNGLTSRHDGGIP